MSYGFPPTLSACEIDGQVVFLDRASHRYGALRPQASRAVLELSRGGRVTDPPAVERLVARGILVAGDQGVTLFTWPAPTLSVLETDDSAKGQAFDAVALARSLLRVQRRQRRFGLDKTLSLMAEQRSNPGTPVSCSGDDHADVIGRSRRFLAARRWSPGRSNCLTDSLALLDFLGPLGRDARLVFGVNLTPWAAHCWVQLDDWVLNDATHRVAALSPILAI